ncbi:MAG: tetratricopeptide repeat protein [Bacteroidia bacterium]|nr:tetratricopeptide repeat protein [Bacteroidia bacterium]
MKNLKIIFCTVVLIFPVIAFSQQNPVDSLISLIKKDKADTNKVIHSYILCSKLLNIGLYDSALYYGNSALQLAQQLNFKKGLSGSNGNLGNVYLFQGNYPKALDHYLKALKFAEDLGDRNSIARHLGNIGIVYQNQEDYPKALDYYFKALSGAEELKDKNAIARHLGNIGNIYKAEAIKNGGGTNKALDYYFRTLKIAKELGDKKLIGIQLANIGSIYYLRRDFPSAIEYSFKGLEIAKELKDKYLIAGLLGNIGTFYTDFGKYKEAELYFKKAIAINDSVGAFDMLRQLEQMLSELYDTTGQYQLALIHYKKAIALKDTLFSQENKKQLVRKEMNFEFEKKEAITKAIAEGENRKQKIITFSVASGLLMVMVFAGFIFRSLRVTKKQKIVIEQQKQIVEEHQKEIISSITYAKRLQEAILPPIPSIKKQFPESFILYNPKDVVAGDFYWMEIMDNIQFIAAADCTGHGVPGAMMSVVCSNALNRAVKEFGLRDTGTILDKVTDLVLETFEKSDSDVKDGMDISILAYNKGNNQIQWSGANNPLCYIQNGTMLEIKADKQPIGLCDNRKPFTTHNITYSENSLFYLLTDGYADQFGGPKGKKFMYKKFKDNLSAICNLPLNEQGKALQTEFNGWKGSLEQVDDVTILGIMI